MPAPRLHIRSSPTLTLGEGCQGRATFMKPVCFLSQEFINFTLHYIADLDIPIKRYGPSSQSTILACCAGPVGVS